MDTTTIMTMIQMLQQQLLQAQNENITKVLPNKSEELLKTPKALTIASEMTPFCNASVTARNKTLTKVQPNFSPKSENSFKLNKLDVAGALGFEPRNTGIKIQELTTCRRPNL